MKTILNYDEISRKGLETKPLQNCNLSTDTENYRNFFARSLSFSQIDIKYG